MNSPLGDKSTGRFTQSRPTITGQFVNLTPLTMSHVDELLVAANEGRSTFTYTWVPSSRKEMLEYVATALKEERLGRTWAFTVRRTPDDIVVGTSRFLDIDYWNVQAPGDGESNLRQELRPRAVEIGGTWYAESAQRTVVNTNTKLLLLSYAFETWVVERVSFKTDHRNWRSRQAIERLGATFEGIRRAHQLAPDGMIRDSAYFSILRSEWPAIREGLQCRLAK